MNTALATLSAAGVSVWLDDLSRQRLNDGSLAQLIQDMSVVGVTTNPSIFHKAITSTAVDYAQQLSECVAGGLTSAQTVRALTVT
ncbi:MAG: transaldolase, partial [Actinobacteria bacterium]|nr:transaldolase [Actinomycetota bacterium]